MRLAFMISSFAFGAALCASSFAEPIVDRYGQYLKEDWQGKIKSDDDLKADAQREAPLLKISSFDSALFDSYGGVKGIGGFEAKGVFYIAKLDGRFFFVTPDGNPYFMVGVDAVGWTEGGYSTPLFENDAPRDVFQELPVKGEFPDAYQGRKVNFLTANLQRKYGADYKRVAAEVVRKRLLLWGFNSTAKWGWGTTVPGFPYIEDCTFKSVKRFGGISRFIDPFDSGFQTAIEEDIQKVVAKRGSDKMLLAYSFENENGWGDEYAPQLLRTDNGFAARTAFVDFLIDRNGGNLKAVADLLGAASSTSREALLAATLSGDKVSKDDASAFMAKASARYHEILRDSLRKYDSKHLLTGASHCAHQSPSWIYAALPFVDFISFNEYMIDSKWIGEHLAALQKADRPYIVTEYSFVQDRRGMRFYNSRNTMRTEAARGLAYRYDSELNASRPLCMGLGYFIFFDQPLTMRSLPNGECCNFGIVNQADQPYWDMVAEVEKSNARLFDVHLGKLQPWKVETKKLLGSVNADKLTEIFIPGSTAESVVLDTYRPEYFNGEGYRLKVDEMDAIENGVIQAGTAFAGEGRSFSGFHLSVYLWNEEPNKDISKWFPVEESRDGLSFTRVETQFVKTTPGEFDEYALSPKETLKNGTHYLRISFLVQHPGKSWENQIGRIVLEK